MNNFFHLKIKEAAQELVTEGFLSQDKLIVAEEASQRSGETLFQVLVHKGYIAEDLLLQRVGRKCGVATIRLSTYHPDPKALALMTPDQARRWKVIPLFHIEDSLTLATANSLDLTVIDEVRETFGHDVEYVLTPVTDINIAVNQYYGISSDTSIGEGTTDARGEHIVAAIDDILEQAARDRASDIHVEPTREGLKIRFRIDGILEEFRSLPKSMERPMTSRIKILGGMDVAERRVPQDGRVRLNLLGQDVDLRIATFPTMYGEAAAIRLLTSEQLITLEQVGFSPSDQKLFEDMIRRPHGMILVTGPTGSGKSTTLYAALMKMNRRDLHILSVEDPVEHEIEGVKQTQINAKAGVTFVSTIRSILRQDPDVIMVGEIRDQETADVSLRAAMTGHLVLSTLHTNTALGAIARLMDLGIESYLVSSVLVGVISQRLVRRICQNCRSEVPIDTHHLDLLGIKGKGFTSFRGKGCRECRMTGFRGRVGLFECVRVSEELKNRINSRASESELMSALQSHDYHSMLADGIVKMSEGVTTTDEVLRVIREG